MATVTAIPRLSKKGKQGRSTIGLRISDRFAFADRYVETLQKRGNIGRYRRLKPTLKKLHAFAKASRLTAFCFVVAFCLQSFSLVSAQQVQTTATTSPEMAAFVEASISQKNAVVSSQHERGPVWWKKIVTAAFTGSVYGIVTDISTGETLPGATVRVEGTALGTATSTNGSFRLNQIPDGPQTLIVSYIGYKTARIPVTIEPNTALKQNIALTFDVPSAVTRLTATLYKLGVSLDHSIGSGTTTDCSRCDCALASTLTGNRVMAAIEALSSGYHGVNRTTTSPSNALSPSV